MNINFTKKPMKPMTTKPMAVLEQILLNSAKEQHNNAELGEDKAHQQFHLPWQYRLHLRPANL